MYTTVGNALQTRGGDFDCWRLFRIGKISQILSNSVVWGTLGQTFESSAL